MAANGDVNITIADGGAAEAILPGTSVAFIMGCSSAGTPAQLFATSNPNTLISNAGYGPLPEAAAMLCQAGGTAVCAKTTSNSAGSASAVQFTGTGTSVITATGTPYDELYVEFLVLNGGTIGQAGITFAISLDGGRTYGPALNLGTAASYAIPNTGLTLNFSGSGSLTLSTGDFAKLKTTPPKWNDAGVQACLTAFQGSQFAVQGVGLIFLVGDMAGADASTFEGYLDTLAVGHVYNRMIGNARDANAPNAWTGASTETESAWVTSISNDFSAVSAKRVSVSAGHYNMPSAFANPAAGAPRYRRPLSWAYAARQVTIPPQRHAGRVKDGSLSQIVIDPTNDPKDGFVYHDERTTPGLDGARFATARTRIGLPGFYLVNPNLMSPPGSQFSILPLGNVIDIACDITQQFGQQEINSDVRLNPNGTIYENDARAIESLINAQLQAQMVAKFMVSSASVTVDRTHIIDPLKGGDNKLPVTVAVGPRGYILELDATVMLVLANQGS